MHTHITVWKNDKTLTTKCGNCGNLLSDFFDKNFVKVTFLLKKILMSWFDEIFWVIVNISFFHTVLCHSVESDEFLRSLILHNFWEISVKLMQNWVKVWFHSILLLKSVFGNSTSLFALLFHTVCALTRNTRQINYFVISIVKTLFSRNFWQKKCERELPHTQCGKTKFFPSNQFI